MIPLVMQSWCRETGCKSVPEGLAPTTDAMAKNSGAMRDASLQTGMLLQKVTGMHYMHAALSVSANLGVCGNAWANRLIGPNQDVRMAGCYLASLATGGWAYAIICQCRSC